MKKIIVASALILLSFRTEKQDIKHRLYNLFIPENYIGVFNLIFNGTDSERESLSVKDYKDIHLIVNNQLNEQYAKYKHIDDSTATAHHIQDSLAHLKK